MRTDLRQSKSDLRTTMRTKLAGLDHATVRQHSATVCERLARIEAFAGAQRLGVYASMGNEIETHGLVRQLLAMGRQVCAPAFAGDRYRLAEVHDFDADLVVGRFGILEPRPGASPCEPDVLVIPGLAFDVRGNRLGRGKGFFDALLREVRGSKIALAHNLQVLNEIPAEAHDVRVDFIVTETKVVHCERDQ